MTTLTPRTVKVRLYQGDDLAAVADLDARAKRAKAVAVDSASTLAADKPEWVVLAEAHDALVAEADERAVTVVLRALGRKAWRDLVAAHPPTEKETDQAIGICEQTFMEPLVAASLVEPEFKAPSDRDAFLDCLSDAQFEILYLNAFAINRALGADPKGRLLSELSQNSSAI